MAELPATITDAADAAAVLAVLTEMVRADPMSVPPVVRGTYVGAGDWGPMGAPNVGAVTILADGEALPELAPPDTGWTTATPAATARLASLAVTAAVRAELSAAIAADPATKPSTAREARQEARRLRTYADTATAALVASAAAWWPSVRAALTATAALAAPTHPALVPVSLIPHTE